MTVRPSTFEDYITNVHATFDAAKQRDPDLRPGQHYFNVLYVLRPDLANKIRGSIHDPFYRRTESELTNFLQWCNDHWNA